jgi:DNA repair protein SbcC/Rad50
MISVEALKAQIEKRFPKAEIVGSTAVRFVRETRDTPYAVCYVDLNTNFPHHDTELASYLDELVGPRYFNEAKSLQWNNYLYFVTTPDRLATKEGREAKREVENDRRYARKFVITEDDLPHVISPATVTSTAIALPANVFSTWMKQLEEVGLDGVILSDDSMPTRIAQIESSVRGAGAQETLTLSTTTPQPQFIKTFDLSSYRPFPQRRHFDFGTFNLIFGSNAVGKTSLLEAIELYYCGRNKRSASKRDQYKLVAALANGQTDAATDQRSLSEFRDRNFAWYGQSEIKTNNLFQSFAKFNFLDTDAAVNISESTNNIIDDLSKLLVGPDASRTWQNMLRVRDALQSKLQDQRSLLNALRAELAELEKAQLSANDADKQSPQLEKQLADTLERLAWRIPLKTQDSSTLADLVRTLVELASFVRQAAGLGWISSPVTINGLKAFVDQFRSISAPVEETLGALENAQREARAAQEDATRAQALIGLLLETTALIEAGVVERHQQRETVSREIVRLSLVLANIDCPAISVWLSEQGVLDDRILADTLRDAQEAEAAAQTAKTQAEANYFKFARVKEEAFNLAQQLRNIAQSILKTQDDESECPLCHTAFAPGELVKHIHEGTDPKLERAGQEFFSRMTLTAADLDRVSKTRDYLDRLSKSGSQSKLGAVSVRVALAEMLNCQQELEQLKGTASDIDAKIQALDAQGLSHSRYLTIGNELAARGCLVSEFSLRTISGLVRFYSGEVTAKQVELEKLATTEAHCVSTLEGMISLKMPFSDGRPQPVQYRAWLSRYKEQITVTEAVSAKIRSFMDTVPWPLEAPLSEFLISINSVRSIATDLQTARNLDAQRVAERADTSVRKANLESRTHEISPRVSRLSEAYSALDTLITHFPLSGAMETTLSSSKSAIESIFVRIHSPAEFSGLGSGFSTLRRKSGDEAALTEVSTGQRAALALSIFLAQNSQLPSGPPAVLIDDPIAHVDDLNCLSFLDYLRDMILDGRRQVFFATANDKIASLIQRKFDFLGDDFKRIQLTRDG